MATTMIFTVKSEEKRSKYKLNLDWVIFWRKSKAETTNHILIVFYFSSIQINAILSLSLSLLRIDVSVFIQQIHRDYSLWNSFYTCGWHWLYILCNFVFAFRCCHCFLCASVGEWVSNGYKMGYRTSSILAQLCNEIKWNVCVDFTFKYNQRNELTVPSSPRIAFTSSHFKLNLK